MKNIVYKFYFLLMVAGCLTADSYAQGNMAMGVTNVIFGGTYFNNSGTGIIAIGNSISCPNCGNQPTVSPCTGTPCTFVMTNVNGVYFVVIGFNQQDAIANGNFGTPPANGGNYGFGVPYAFTGTDGTGIPSGYSIAGGRQGTYNGPATNGWSTITVSVTPPGGGNILTKGK